MSGLRDIESILILISSLLQTEFLEVKGCVESSHWDYDKNSNPLEDSEKKKKTYHIRKHIYCCTKLPKWNPWRTLGRTQSQRSEDLGSESYSIAYRLWILRKFT
jgi:hypothetical protein